MYRLGIDLGGTKIEAALLDENQTILKRHRVPTEAEHGYGHILSNIHRLFSEMTHDCIEQIKCLGIGTPGAISLKTGMLKNSNTQCLNNRPLQEDLTRLLNLPVHIENDANCFALAEALSGAGRGHNTVFGIILGTGCGGGLILNQTIHRGLQRIGGEWGHMSIDPNGPECYCGRRGCVETYLSGGGLEQRYFEATHERLHSEQIWEQYNHSDPRALTLIHQYFDFFGRSVGNLINILDPDIIVMGGGLSGQAAIYSLGVESVSKYVFGNDFKTPIVPNELGDSAGVIGAALL